MLCLERLAMRRAAHAVNRLCRLGFSNIDHESFGGQDHGRDGSCTLLGAVGHFGRVNDAGLELVFRPLGHRVVADRSMVIAPVCQIVALWINNLVRYSIRAFIPGLIVASFRQHS